MKSILTHFKPGNLKANHFHNSKFPALLKFGKHKTTNKTLFNHFPAIWVMDVLRCTYLVRTGGSGAQAPSRSLARSTIFFASVLVGSWISVHCSYRWVCGFRELITQQHTNLLSNSICRHKRNELSTRNCCMSQTACC